MARTASKLGAGRNDVSSAAEIHTAAASTDHSDDTAADLEVNDLAAARAQLRARVGARGRRSSRPGRGAGGQGQVKLVRVSRKYVRRFDGFHNYSRRYTEARLSVSFVPLRSECNCFKSCVALSGIDTSFSPFCLFVHPVTPKQQLSPPQPQGSKKEKREKRGTVWHDGSGGGKQLGQKAKEALDRSKV